MPDARTPVRPKAPAWSLHPLAALLLAATDVVAGGGDVAFAVSGPLGLALVVLIASGTSVAVWLIEFISGRRFLRAGALAAATWVLVILPTPVAGLVGAGASLGARLASRRSG